MLLLLLLTAVRGPSMLVWCAGIPRLLLLLLRCDVTLRCARLLLLLWLLWVRCMLLLLGVWVLLLLLPGSWRLHSRSLLLLHCLRYKPCRHVIPCCVAPLPVVWHHHSCWIALPWILHGEPLRKHVTRHLHWHAGCSSGLHCLQLLLSIPARSRSCSLHMLRSTSRTPCLTPWTRLRSCCCCSVRATPVTTTPVWGAPRPSCMVMSLRVHTRVLPALTARVLAAPGT
jgi:hypothetical protein